MIRGALPTDGLLRVDKPVGPTSHDMVARARRALGLKKVGHTGTLDPFASGLLLLCLGSSTRLAEYLSDLPKEYAACARLGEVTATGDPEGEVVERSEAWRDLGSSEISEALQAFAGTSDQTPPTFSAKKVDGERAYRRARRGDAVELDAVPIVVHEIEIVEVDLPHVRFRVRCSTGTYVRALARDLGERLGVGAHLTELRRTAIGPFVVDGAVAAEALGEPRAMEVAWIAPLAAVAHLPLVEDPSDEALARLRAGQALSAEELGAPPHGASGDLAVARDGRLVAIASRDGDRIRPRKVFPDADGSS